jgi:hypothetical protein
MTVIRRLPTPLRVLAVIAGREARRGNNDRAGSPSEPERLMMVVRLKLFADSGANGFDVIAWRPKGLLICDGFAITLIWSVRGFLGR